MSTTVPTYTQTVQLAMFEGWRIEEAKLALAGTIDLSMFNDAALVAALKLGAKVTVTIAVGDQTVSLDAEVDRRQHGIRKDKEMGAIPWTSARVKVLDDEGDA